MEELNTVEYGKITVAKLLQKVNANRDAKTEHYRSMGMHQVGVASEDITLKDYRGFKLGDTVTVLKKPDYWSAEAGKYPFGNAQIGQTSHVTEYPFTGQVAKLTTWFKSSESNKKYKLIELGGVGINIGGFGFSLTELIERKLIKSDKVNLGIPDSLPPGHKVDSIHDLVIGQRYRPIVNKEYMYKEQGLLLQDVYSDNLELYNSWNFHDRHISAKLAEVEALPNQPKPSQRILKLIAKLRQERYVYGYDGGPGGGGGGTIDLTKTPTLPGFDKDGNEFVFLKVDGLKRCFAAEKIEQLFQTGSTSQSFRATEWTTITTELKLIADKTKLPKESRWSTMRD